MSCDHNRPAAVLLGGFVAVVVWGCLAASCSKNAHQAGDAGEQARVAAEVQAGNKQAGDAQAADACPKQAGGEVAECHYQRLAKQYQARDFRQQRSPSLYEEPPPGYLMEPVEEVAELESVEMAEEEPPPKGEEQPSTADRTSEEKKEAVIAILENKKKQPSKLSHLLGKDRNLAVKNVVWGEDGQFAVEEGLAVEKKQPALKGRTKRRSSRVKLGSGSLGQFCNKPDVKRKVIGRAAALRSCYATELQTKPEMKGEVTVQWIIELTGEVKDAKVVQNTTGDEKLGQCVTKIIEKLHFQKPAGSLCIVRWPLAFEPGE